MSEHAPGSTAQEAAAAKGLVVVEPKDNELFVDIDDAASFEVFKKHIELVNAILPCAWRAAPSPSGKPDRLHITVTCVHPVTNIERIALQAVLGSDRLHETLSLVAHYRGDKTPTVFFEKPQLPELPRYEP